jgi:hypothetical protein
VALLSPRRPNVQRLKRKENLDGLRAALRYRETFVDEEGLEWDAGVDIRIEAAEAMSHFNGPAVADDLAEAVGDLQPEVRLAAVEAISRLGMAVGVDALLDCVIGGGNGSSELEMRALEVLTGWHLEGLPEIFVERLLRPDGPPVEERHGEAFGRILAADPRGSAAGSAVADIIIASLDRPLEEPARAWGERILGRLGTPAAESVLEALANGRPSPALVRAAGSLGDVRAVEPLIQCLDSSDPEMRRSAAVAAGSLNHTGTVPALLGAMQDPERSVRDAAGEALNRMGTAAMIVGIVTVLGGGSDQQVVEQAGEAQLADATEPHGEVVPQPPGSTSPPGRQRTGGIVDRLFGRPTDPDR